VRVMGSRFVWWRVVRAMEDGLKRRTRRSRAFLLCQHDGFLLSGTVYRARLYTAALFLVLILPRFVGIYRYPGLLSA
jgi:hypothetical protein